MNAGRGSDKFAAMAAANRDSARRGKVLSASASTASNNNSEPPPPIVPSEARAQQRQQRLQRQPLWNDLRRAEELTLELLKLASKSTSMIAECTCENNGDEMPEESLKENGKKYIETLNSIHSLLKPHAHYVVNYQTHQTNTNNSNQIMEEEESSGKKKETPTANMYATRVEMRLAREKQSVLKEWVRLEQEEIKDASSSSSNNDSLKRKLDSIQ